MWNLDIVPSQLQVGQNSFEEVVVFWFHVAVSVGFWMRGLKFFSLIFDCPEQYIVLILSFATKERLKEVFPPKKTLKEGDAFLMFFCCDMIQKATG